MTTFVDMFAGIGGFRLAFERLGWKCVGYIENDKKSLQSYRANFDVYQEYFWDDATTLDPNNLPNFDVLAAGFPCQPWSAAGKRGGFDDARGTLFFDIARVLKAKNPRAFLLENVKGLLFEDNKPSMFRMLSILRSLGYAIFVKVLNSRDFGVPQNRERVFFVGFKADGFQESEFNWPKPIPRASKLSDILDPNPDPKYDMSKRMVDTLLDHLRRGTTLSTKSTENVVASLDLLNYDRNSQIREGDSSKALTSRAGRGFGVVTTNPHYKGEARGHHTTEHSRTLSATGTGTNIPMVLQETVMAVEIVGDRGHPESRKNPTVLSSEAFTLDANPMSDRHQVLVLRISSAESDIGRDRVKLLRDDMPSLMSGSSSGWASYNQAVKQGFRLRRFTPRECLRLMGIPDTYKIVVSDWQLYRQAGNSVVVPVIEAIARAMESRL